MARTNIRALAARTLGPVIGQGQSLNGLFEPAMERLDAQDRGLFQQLCFGTLRQCHELQCIASALLDKPLRAKDSDVYALLLLGLYQLIHLRTPDHAALSETVSASRKLHKAWASKLLNGVLRRFIRERTTLEAHLAQDPEYRFSHPRWLIDAIGSAWPRQSESIFQANNAQPPLCLRINARRCNRDDYLQRLQQQGIAAQPLPSSPFGLRLAQAVDVRQLPGYSDGDFSVQDEAAQLCGELLALAAGQRVLDACAAPGGKSCQLLEHPAGIGALVCVEQDASRMERVQQNLSRLHLRERAELHVANAGEIAAWWDGRPFDRILLDAPCSATGVIRRHPDIKLLRRPDDIDKLAALQLQLLSALWPTLAPGGLLLYATCSVLPQENDSVVQQFVTQQDDALHQPIGADWGSAKPFGRQLLPQMGGHDGFYYARLVKRESGSAAVADAEPL